MIKPQVFELDLNAFATEAKNNVLEALTIGRGQKSLILDRSLTPILNRILKFSELHNQGIDKIYYLDDSPDSDLLQNTVIYLVRSSIPISRLIASHIRQLSSSGKDFEFNVILIPENSFTTTSIFEEEGVKGDINISKVSISFVPLDKDFISLELQNAGFQDLYKNKFTSTIYYSGLALHELQVKYGFFPKILGVGSNAKAVSDLITRKRNEYEVSIDLIERQKITGNIFEQLIIIERKEDIITPLMTQLTYDGLIDEYYGIKGGYIKLPNKLASFNTSQPQTSSTTSHHEVFKGDSLKKMMIDPEDKIHNEIKDLNFMDVGSYLNSIAHKLSSDYNKRHEAQTVSQIKEFVSKIPMLESEHQSLHLHTNIAEDIMFKTQSDFFNLSLEVQQNLAGGGLDMYTIHQKVEELIYNSGSLQMVIRLLCLESILNGGLKEKDLASFKKLICESYGYQHLLTFNSLINMGLIHSKSKASLSYFSYLPLKRILKLVMDQSKASNKNDISYLYSGYVPLSVRLIQCVVDKSVLGKRDTPLNNWKGAEEVVKNINGPVFEESHKGETKALRAKLILSGQNEVRTTVLFFLGGITYGEVSVIRCLAEKFKDRRKFIIATTGMINGNDIIDIATCQNLTNKL